MLYYYMFVICIMGRTKLKGVGLEGFQDSGIVKDTGKTSFRNPYTINPGIMNRVG